MSDLTQEQVNRIIQEKVRGKCWHTSKMDDNGFLYCPKCGKHYFVLINETGNINPDFSQWERYGPLLEEIQGKTWWSDVSSLYDDYYDARVFNEVLLNPTRGSLAIAEFVLDNPDWFKED